MNRVIKYQILLMAAMLLIMKNITAQTAKTFTLKEVYELAIANSSQLKLAQNGLKTSQAATQLVRNALLPAFDATLSASYIGNGLLTDRDFSGAQNIKMPHWGNNFGIEASQVIFAGGAISTSIEKAKLDEQVAQLNYERNELDVCFLLTGYYLDLYKFKNQREVFLKNIEQTELLIKQIKAKESEGMALNSDVTRHELMLQNLKLALIEIGNNSKIINQQMIVTLGLPAETIIIPDSSVFELHLDTLGPEKLNDLAAKNLPELKLASLNKTISDKELRIAKSEIYPQIALVAANHFDGPILVEVPTINSNFNYWYAGIGLKYNIASLYRTNRKLNVARQNREAAGYSEALALEHMQVMIHHAYTKFRESMEKLAVFESNLKLAEENYRIINNRYLSELVLITEMLDASNTRLNAELQVANARLEVIYNYFRLQREIGNKITQ